MEHHLLIWRAACTPHRDIREDAVSEALFAVNLSRPGGLRAVRERGGGRWRES